MPRATKKELEDKIKQQQNIIQMQFKKIDELQNEKEAILKNKNVVNKVEFDAVVKDLERLQNNYETLKDLFVREEQRNSKLVDNCTELKKQVKGLERKHNERGAGRKSKLTKEQLEKVNQLHKKGLSYKKIGDIVGISKAYAYKLINKEKYLTK